MPQQEPQTRFQKAVAELLEAKAAFTAGTIKPVPYADARQAALATALFAMAECHSVILQAPLQIDSRGEFSIVALKVPGGDARYGTGKFGVEYAARLTRHKARTGVYGPAIFDESNGWAILNHFSAEAMVLEYAGELQPA